MIIWFETGAKPRALARGYAPSSVDLAAYSPSLILIEAVHPPDVMRQYREHHSVGRWYPRRVARCGYRQKTTQALPNPAKIGIMGA